MRRILEEIPLTFESLALSGMENGRVKKTEIFFEYMLFGQFSCGNIYDYVIAIIKKHLKKEKDKIGLY